MAALRHTSLDAEHRALGARMVEFGGWEMPIQYSSVLEEHRACREHAVAFDVSHLGSLHVQGDGALDLLQSAFTNDVGRIAPGQAQYTHLLDPADAHVVDDIIVWWLADDDFIVMPNASNTSRIADALAGDHSCTVEDITMSRAIIAVQGPEARKTLAPVVTSDVERFHVAPTTYGSADGFIAGTGYTGEDGVELHVPREAAAETWRAVVAAGIQPAGLGARDTLRLEAGLPLHGHELGPGITTLQAGLGWVVRWDKGDFRGRDALLAEKERGVDRKLRGLLVAGRQIPREGCRVSIDGKEVGAVTSGNISPMLQQGIALAFLPPGVSDGTQVEIDIRGRTATAKVVKPPFFKRA
ncbi:MAG: glycine cleavage system aminomethyltransferase GcvT [Actinobacteria bacterium]|nr:glycine cleavage system aminomethyltransferase GcvT [Actinomycetota bacterium]